METASLWIYYDVVVTRDKKLTGHVQCRACNAVFTYESKTHPTKLKETLLATKELVRYVNQTSLVSQLTKNGCTVLDHYYNSKTN